MFTQWFRFLALSTLLALGTQVFAQDQDNNKQKEKERILQLVKNLNWKTGAFPLEGVAKVTTSGNYRFLDSADASHVLTDLWRNPPQKSLGMLFPDNKGPLDSHWAVIVEGFENEGYVKDADADKLDANALLKQLQEAQKAGNEERKKQGYPELELVGWAVPPRYEKEAKKLYWAIELREPGGTESSVNYYIRILGRRGYLVLNALGSMNSIPQIEAATPEVLSMVEFDQGHRYADFNPSTDKVATYGIAGLIIGAVGLKLAAKAGILAYLASKFGFILLFLKKGFIIVIAAFAALWKKITGLFRRKEDTA